MHSAPLGIDDLQCTCYVALIAGCTLYTQNGRAIIRPRSPAEWLAEGHVTCSIQCLNGRCNRGVDVRLDALPQDQPWSRIGLRLVCAACDAAGSVHIVPNWHDSRGKSGQAWGRGFDSSNETRHRTPFCGSGSRRPPVRPAGFEHPGGTGRPNIPSSTRLGEAEQSSAPASGALSRRAGYGPRSGGTAPRAQPSITWGYRSGTKQARQCKSVHLRSRESYT
ncbi:hypothetical protein ACVWXO_008269 [Bradyrhizobium sp. LM2.7]